MGDKYVVKFYRMLSRAILLLNSSIMHHQYKHSGPIVMWEEMLIRMWTGVSMHMCYSRGKKFVCKNFGSVVGFSFILVSSLRASGLAFKGSIEIDDLGSFSYTYNPKEHNMNARIIMPLQHKVVSLDKQWAE